MGTDVRPQWNGSVDGPLRVAVLDDYQSVALNLMELPEGVVAVAFADHVSNVDRLIARLAGFQVVVCMRERTMISAEILDRLVDLRLVVTTGPVNAAIDLVAAKKRGIPVCGTAARHAQNSTTEHTWALLLGLARLVAVQDAAIRAGGWQVGLATQLSGRTIGLVGLGRLGSAMVPVAKALGMRVIAWSTNLTDERAIEVGVTRVDHDELFSTADVLSVHLLLSERSVDTIAAPEFALMKKSALLVNTSRGPIVNEKALIEALSSGRIGGAAIDVYDLEPLSPDHPLRRCPNTLLAPHTGYVSDLAYQEFFAEVAEDIRGYLDGTLLREVPIGVLAVPKWAAEATGR
jgi:phosphoglycerate dehydrogenase-like enzyme